MMRFKKQQAITALKFLVSSSIFYRGREYYNNDCVVNITTIPSKKESIFLQIDAIVIGTNSYNTCIFFDCKKFVVSDIQCSCPVSINCKHGVALALEVFDLVDVIQSDFFSKDFPESSTINFQRFLIDQIQKKLNITDNEFNSKESKKKELQIKLRSIGINPDLISKKMLQSLYFGSAYTKKKINLKNENIEQNVQEKKIKKIVYRGKVQKYKALYNDVYIVCDIKRNFACILESKNTITSPYYRHSIEPLSCLDEAMYDLTVDQKKLLVYLAENNVLSEKYNHGTVFDLIKKSELDLFYVDNRGVLNSLKISTSSFVIGTASLMRTVKNVYVGTRRTKETVFLFKLDEKLFNSSIKRFNFSVSNNHILFLSDSVLFVRAISFVTQKILRRYIDERIWNDYRIQKKINIGYTITLTNEEILKINDLINDLRLIYKLETNITKLYTLEKYSVRKPILLADYRHDKKKLMICPAIDYGAHIIVVSDTVFLSRRHDREVFLRRKGNEDEQKIIFVSGAKIKYAHIAPRAEIALFKKFYDNHVVGFNKHARVICSSSHAITAYAKKYWSLLKQLKIEIVFLHDEFNFIEENFTADFTVDLNTENDWLTFDAKFYCGKNNVNINNLIDYVENNQEFLKTESGQYISVKNRSEIERLVLMLESFHMKKDGLFEGKTYHAPEVEHVFTSSQFYTTKMKSGFTKFLKEAQSGKPVLKVRKTAFAERMLRDYQKDGVDWFHFLRKYRFAGILADDMGLGKTLQALTLLDMYRIKTDKPSLIVCPKTLLYNWQDEVEKFYPKMRVLILDGLPKDRHLKIKNLHIYDLIVTSYATVQKDKDIYKKNNVSFYYCILDEAQYIKNHTTKNARFVKEIDAEYRLALTGTPLENSVSEIWSIFDFLMPGFLGSYTSFVKKYQNPIMKENDLIVLEELHKKTACFMLRRTKDNVLKELPHKIEQVHHCRLGIDQNILYQEILANVKTDILKTVEQRGFSKSQIHILAGLMKLRQVCNHPALLLKDHDYTKYSSAKLDVFNELISEIISSQKKVLVFSQFTSMLFILEKELQKNNIQYVVLTGKTHDRQRVVKDFNSDPRISVFLISLKAGGTGLNLTSAEHVIIFDPWWNPSVENQAIDRAHRIGQKSVVQVHRIVTKGTIEDRILLLQEKKKFLFDNMVGESKDLFKKLTWDDIRGLFE